MDYRNYVRSIMRGQSFIADVDGGGPADGTTTADADAGSGDDGTEDSDDSADQADADNPKDKDKQKSGESEKTFTESQVQAMITARLERERNKAKADAEEAEKLKKMNADEKSKYQLEKLQEERDEANAKVARYEMTRVARTQLADTGIAMTDEELGLIVTDTAETTKANVATFSALVKRVREDERQKYLGGHTPGLNGQKVVSSGETFAKERNEEHKVADDPWKKLRS